MKKVGKKLLCFLCALCMLTSGIGDFGLFARAVPVELTRELTASDERTYRITVTYDTEESGIPADAVLSVTELRDGDEGYAGFVARSAETLGERPEDLRFARAFDISLRDAATGAEYEPDSSVRVSVRLLDETLEDSERIGVVHFHDDPDAAAEAVQSAVEDGAVAFTADGFSVYVLVGAGSPPSNVPHLTYHFKVWDADLGDYKDFQFTTDLGETTYAQSVKNGETPVVPQPASPVGVQYFAGWYLDEDDDPTNGIVLSADPYDFGSVVITEDAEVTLYAKYITAATVVFHDQYDASSGTYPVAFTRTGEMSGGSAWIKVDDVETNFIGGAGMKFYGWSRTAVRNPGEGLSNLIDTDAQGRIQVSTYTTDLYPLFKPVFWLTYYAGYSGSGADYVPPAAYYGSDTLTSLPTTARTGYEFLGWYTGSLSGEDVTYNSRVSHADGSLIDGDYGSVQVVSGTLMLRSDTTLYARWNAMWRVVIWKQTPDGSGYEYVQTDTFSDAIPTSVTVPESCKNYNFPGYRYGHCDEAAQTTSDRNIVTFNVYYDLNGYTLSGETHTLSFDTTGGSTIPPVTGLAYEAPLSNPGTPIRANHSFNGWYMDPFCTIPADLSTMKMPDRDLTVYAAWEPDWYLVKVDPNYGALYSYDSTHTLVGTGATWFWQSYDGDPIGEYTHVTRDFVESSSGTWYYVKHDYGYYNDNPPGGADRKTYYTQDPGEATEDTRFERVPGAYTYAGWYEVHADGSETPFVFGGPMTHPTTLRLHWKRTGIFYLGYDPGTAGGLLDTNPNSAEPLILEGKYADYSNITLTRAAIAPSGYVFVGWQIRGDSSGKLYTPGSSLTLLANQSIRSGGKDVVWLDAVYVQVETAHVVYNANGGTVASSGVSFGALPPAPGETDPTPIDTGVIDTAAGTVTVTGLVNNSRYLLSDGTGFSYTYTEGGVEHAYTLVGWSLNPVYDPVRDTLFDLGVTAYGVDTAEPTTLYAVWAAKVTYHLNAPEADPLNPVYTNWGGTDGDPNTWGDPADPQNPYTKETLSGETVHTQTAYLGGTVAEPVYIPQFTDPTDFRMFYQWRTAQHDAGTAADNDDVYNFTTPITAPLELYAYWSGPIEVPVHAVDASAEALVNKDVWLTSGAVLKVRTTSLDLDAAAAAACMDGGAAPADYRYAFAVALPSGADLSSIAEENAVTAIRYNQSDKRLYVTYADPGRAEAPLEEGAGIYFIYYKERALDIAYRSAAVSGALTPVSIPGAPTSTVTLLGEFDMQSSVYQPLTWAGMAGESFTCAAYAIGTTGAANATQLSLITNTFTADAARPALRLRNTWRGFQYSTDGGTSWSSCGYDISLYVIYFVRVPSIVTVRETTVGTAAVMDTEFTYHFVVTQSDQSASDPPLLDEYYQLKNGMAQSVILYYDGTVDPAVSQTLTVTQTRDTDFDTAIDDVPQTAEPYRWTYTSTDAGGSHFVTYKNTHRSAVEVHVAILDSAGGLTLRDDLRNPASEFAIAPNGTEVLLDRLASDYVLDDDTYVYSFGAAFSGSIPAANGDAVSVSALGINSVKSASVNGDSVYALQLFDAAGNLLGKLSGEEQLYYLYYRAPRLRYIKETADGIELISGSTDGVSTISDPTYARAPLTMNGQAVAQGQKLAVTDAALRLSQTGSGSFRMPAILDDGLLERYLVYRKLGVGGYTDLAVTETDNGQLLNLQIRKKNSSALLQYSYDGTQWKDFLLADPDDTPTVYALYSGLGYDLQISKTVDTTESGDDPIVIGRVFTVTVRSTAILESAYDADGYETAQVTATPASGGNPGEIVLRMRDGDRIRIRGLGQGDYTVTESENDSYTLSAKIGPLLGTPAEMIDADFDPSVSSTIRLTLDGEKKLDLVNAPKKLCKIIDGGADHVFYSFARAMAYVDANIPSRTAVIRMLTDYVMPADDALEVPVGYNITLTTASGTGTNPYTGSSADHKAVISRSSALSGASMFTNLGTLAFENITIDGASVGATAPMIDSSGNVVVGSGSTIKNAKNSGNGGAIRASSGTITVSDGAMQDNSAANGGAIFADGSVAISLSGTARLSGNSASANGGAIYSTGGTVSLQTETVTFSGNKALSGMGGAIWAGTSTVSVPCGAFSGNQAANGGAICVNSGTVDLSGGQMSGNGAANGGAVYAVNGTVNVSGTAALSGNTASVNGGAIYADSGTINVSGGAIGGSNKAVDGAGLFVNTGTANFSANASVTGNIATGGGAVGVGATTARLNLSGKVKITGNTMNGNPANVCLSVDSDVVINASGLNSAANIGVYVPGAQTGTLFKNRGDVGARFAAFTNDSEVAAVFHNDREPNLMPVKDTLMKRIYWGSPIKVEVRWLENYGAYPNGFPPKAAGQSKATVDNYYPVSSSTTLSELAEDLRAKNTLNLNNAAVFGAAFIGSSTFISSGAAYAGDTGYGQYLTRLVWSDGEWKVQRHDGTFEALDGRKIVIYFSYPAYISIENNTAYDLTVSELKVLDQSALNNYGLVFALNGAIQPGLAPVSDPLILEKNGGSVSILIPGGRNQFFTFTGLFTDGSGNNATGTIPWNLGGQAQADLDLSATNPVQVTGEKTFNSSAFYEIIFGNAKAICRIITNAEVANADDSEYTAMAPSELGWEYTFPTLNKAKDFAVRHGLTELRLEMLTDYLVPDSDALKIKATDGFQSIELTTALTGAFTYPGSSEDRRATISRGTAASADGWKDPLITINGGKQVFTFLSVHDLNFDGKSLGGTSDGGALKTNNCELTVNNSCFVNFIAYNGGGLFASFGDTAGNNFSFSGYSADAYNNHANVTVTNAEFRNCDTSGSTKNRNGGGGVWTNGKSFTLMNSVFDNCKAKDQGGAVFHRIECEGTYKYPYHLTSTTIMDNCSFSNCNARAAGGIETDALDVNISNSTFTQCNTASDNNGRGGGGLNIYIHDSANSTLPSKVTVTNCEFNACTARRDGGGMNSAAMSTTISNCRFYNCKVTGGGNSGNRGGAIYFKNQNSTTAEVYGCTIDGCSVSGSVTPVGGGGISCNGKNLTVGDYTDPVTGKTASTVISNCSSSANGGGIHHNNTKGFTSLTNCTIEGCTAKDGSGLNSKAPSITLESCLIRNNTATRSGGYGGGIYCEAGSSASLSLKDTVIEGNVSSGYGGGIYTNSPLTMVNTRVTGNHLNAAAANAAGIYIPDNLTLKVGMAGAASDSTTVSGNYGSGSVLSNLRLPEKNSGSINDNKVIVKCGLSGQIGVVNAKKLGTQFGTSSIQYPVGFSDTDAVFRSDNSTLYGIVNRQNGTGVDLIWAGPPVCKLTDRDGNQLFFKTGAADPAIFDVLEDGLTGGRTSAFALLRGTPVLYLANGNQYDGTYYIRMIVPQYTLDTQINVQTYLNRSVVLTTAGKNDALYPYEGAAGGRSTITRAAGGIAGSMAVVNTNLTLENVILDGGSASGAAASTENGGVIRLAGNSTFELGDGAILQNAMAPNGGAVYVNSGKLKLNGGRIRFCEATNDGGGVYINSGASSVHEFTAGSIEQCSAVHGGGVMIHGGSFRMTYGTIERCSATEGGGVYVPNNTSQNFYMGGGTITRNTATGKGGGIAVEGKNSRLYFSGQCIVSGNTKNGEACNVELDQDSNEVINTYGDASTTGLYNGANIGVYVPGVEGSDSLYDKHGLEGKPFGHYPYDNHSKRLYCFTNDRNGLKGGLSSDPEAPGYTIYWSKVFSLEVKKEVLPDSSLNETLPNGVKVSEDTFRFTVMVVGELDGEYGEDGMVFTYDPVSGNSTAEFYLKAGESKSAVNLAADLLYTVSEHLTEDQQLYYVPSPTDTYSGKIGENIGNTNIPMEDWYTSRVTVTNLLPVCKITDNSGNLLYYRSGTMNAPAVYTSLADAFAALSGSFYVGAAIDSLNYTGDSCQIQMLTPDCALTEGIALASGRTVTLTTAPSTVASDARKPVYRGTEGTPAVIRRDSDFGSMFTVNGTLTVTNVVLDGGFGSGYTSESSGGIANVTNGGTLRIRTDAELRNSRSELNGGAVCVNSGGTVEMSGGTIDGNRSGGNGAGVYLAAGSTMKLSGTVRFGGTGTDEWGAISPTGGNLAGALTGKTNGGKSYPVARQDIYLAETEEEPASLVLTGSLSCEAGSIWLWAEHENHYAMLKPFARTADGVNISDASYKAFRNAQTDNLTLCGAGAYLSGSRGENDAWLYWGGGFDLRFTKIDGYGKPLPGAVFTLFTDADCLTPLQRGSEDVTATSADGTAAFQTKLGETLDPGVVLLEQIPTGTYYMKETTLPAGWINALTANAAGTPIPNRYVVLVGNAAMQPGVGILANITQEDLDAQTGGDGNAAIFLIDSETGLAVATPNIARYGLMNISRSQRKVIFKKVNDTFKPLEGATFDILRYDQTAVALYDTESGTGPKSLESGVIWIGKLPFGTYYLHETAPVDRWFSVVVAEDGTHDPIEVEDPTLPITTP